MIFNKSIAELSFPEDFHIEVYESELKEHMNSVFNTWIDTYLSEKGIDLEELLEVEGSLGMNHIPIRALIDAIKGANCSNQKEIKSIIVKIDTANGNVRHFLTHLAKAIVL